MKISSIKRPLLMLIPLLAIGCAAEELAEPAMMAGMTAPGPEGMPGTPDNPTPPPVTPPVTPPTTPPTTSCIGDADCMLGERCDAGSCVPNNQPPTPPPTPPTEPGGASCVDTIQCISACSPEDQVCGSNCLMAASQEAIAQISALRTCFDNAECPEGDQMCLGEACSTQLAACQSGGSSTPPSPPPPPPGSNYSCAEVLFCLNGCPDQTCGQACVAAGTPEAQTAYQSLSTCYTSNQCQDQSCVDTNCSVEYNTCFPPGNVGCGATIACLRSCQTPECAFDCELNSSQEARNLLSDIGACMNMNNCMSPECPACSAQVSACEAN